MNITLADELPERKFLAHIVSYGSDSLIHYVAFDGRANEDEIDALILQSAIDPQDGLGIFAEVPTQRYQLDDRVAEAELTFERFRICFSSSLGGFHRWSIQFKLSESEYRKLRISMLHVFARDRDILKCF